MRKELIISLLVVGFNFNSFSQFGGGVNIGYRNTGLELRGLLVSRINILGALNVNRFDAFSNKFGINFSLRPIDKKHNFGLSSSAEYTYSKTVIIEAENIFYKYTTNSLNCMNVGVIYSLKFDSGAKNNGFLLLEMELFWKQIFTQLNINADISNTQTSVDLENSISKYYHSGIGFSFGIKYMFSIKQRLTSTTPTSPEKTQHTIP
jgi:hypothetical protein